MNYYLFLVGVSARYVNRKMSKHVVRNLVVDSGAFIKRSALHVMLL